MSGAPTVSVLICTAGRPELLDRALTRLGRGSQSPDQVVIVNGADDGANDVVLRHCDTFDEVVLLQYENQNLAVSRNLGLPLCTGEIIALTDDDAVVAPGWIASLTRIHTEEPRAGAVGGPVQGSVAHSFISRVADRVVFPHFSERRLVRTLPGVNVSFKRAVVERVGLFDESLFRGEDVDYNWRVLREGDRILYDPEIRVEHEHRATFFGLLQQQWMYGRAYVLVRRKWPDMYCVYPHELRTFHDWAKLAHCVLATLYQPALAARHMGRTREVLLAYPLLVVHHAIWKVAMVRQGSFLRRSDKVPAGVPPAANVRVALISRWQGGELIEEQRCRSSD